MKRWIMALGLFLMHPVSAAKPLAVEIKDLDETGAANAIDQIHKALIANPKQIWIKLNTRGGGVYSGMDVVHALEDAKKLFGTKIICAVDIKAYSMGFVILQSVCDERLMTERSLLLAHNAWTESSGSAEELASAAKMLYLLSRNFAVVCAARLGMPLNEYMYLIQYNWILDSAEALSANAIDRIIQPHEIPPVM